MIAAPATTTVTSSSQVKRLRAFGIQIMAAALAAAMISCDLMGPAESNSFRLVRVNGLPVPYTIRRSRGLIDTNTIAEIRWREGALTMFVGGRIDWTLTSDVLFNGEPREDIPPHTDHRVGAYSFRGDSIFFRDLKGEVSRDGRVLTMHDPNGAYDFATFEFERP